MIIIKKIFYAIKSIILEKRLNKLKLKLAYQIRKDIYKAGTEIADLNDTIIKTLEEYKK